MKLIKTLSEMIEEEIEDAENYAKCALNHKESDPELAHMFYNLANEELGHMEKIHKQVERLISQKRELDGEPPAPMMAVYNFLHERNIDHVLKIRMILDEFRK